MAQCTATSKRTKKQCGRQALAGGTVCAMHGGKAPQVQKAAQRRVAIAEALRLVDLAGVSDDPAEHLLEALKRSYALARVFGAEAAELHERGSLVSHSEYGEHLHPYGAEYRRILETYGRLAKLCLDAGIAERAMRVAEEQAELIVAYTKGLLSDLGINPGSEKARVAVRKHLTLIAGGRS